MTEDTIEAAQRALGYTFRDTELLRLALTHASVADSRLGSNERMEFLGDSVLGLIVSERCFRRFPSMLEGELTKIKSTAVSRATCAQIARDLGLHDLLALGKGVRNANDMPQSLAAAVLESVIAAIYLDGGMEAAVDFVAPFADELIERAAECGHQENFKSILQQRAQQDYGHTPQYRVLDEKGPDHSKCFKVCVDLGNRRHTPAWGQSKKRAEQLAALNALREIGAIEEGSDGRLRVVGPRTNGEAIPDSDPVTAPEIQGDASSPGSARPMPAWGG